ncbi:hypothetical protein E2C01_010958 [Portunus trituberculatus]|uniref:Uncharacterized protein n=1 Tax=Portunus trituberculatus TaxID=210409 RepID=A0A5B7D9R4_PORTR|nr:hypothetical protein [Portunus trituberculatus]
MLWSPNPPPSTHSRALPAPASRVSSLLPPCRPQAPSNIFAAVSTLVAYCSLGGDPRGETGRPWLCFQRGFSGKSQTALVV